MTESDKAKVIRRLKGEGYGRYTFKLELCGYGDNPDEAWMSAVIGFSMEPGEFPEDYDFEEEDEG